MCLGMPWLSPSFQLAAPSFDLSLLRRGSLIRSFRSWAPGLLARSSRPSAASPVSGAPSSRTARHSTSDVSLRKLPLTDVADDLIFVYAELEAMIHLHHPNVVKFYASWPSELV